MYPPIRNLTSNTHTITDQSYGNGTYVVSESTIKDSSRVGYSAFSGLNSPGVHYKENEY